MLAKMRRKVFDDALDTVCNRPEFRDAKDPIKYLRALILLGRAFQLDDHANVLIPSGQIWSARLPESIIVRHILPSLHLEEFAAAILSQAHVMERLCHHAFKTTVADRKFEGYYTEAEAVAAANSKDKTAEQICQTYASLSLWPRTENLEEFTKDTVKVYQMKGEFIFESPLQIVVRLTSQALQVFLKLPVFVRTNEIPKNRDIEALAKLIHDSSQAQLQSGSTIQTMYSIYKAAVEEFSIAFSQKLEMQRLIVMSEQSRERFLNNVKTGAIFRGQAR